MKYLTLLFLLMFSSITIHAQSVTVTSDQNNSSNSQNSFLLHNNSLVVGSNSLQIGGNTIDHPRSWAKSYQGKKVSLLVDRGDLFLLNMDATGKSISENNLEFFEPTDQTLKVYSFDDGRAVVRDNVANFTFFDATGELLYSFSNSSQSADGERESQLSSDEKGRTIVLYNPVIAYGNNTGSRANIVYGEENSREIFRDSEREIRQLSVSDDGAFITLLAGNAEGTYLILYDRFGNELYQYQTEDELLGVTLSSDANYITKYSSGRVQVYNVQTGESMGNASSRSSIIFATFVPEDQTVLALGGSVNGRNISSPTITAVHLGLRQITRNDINIQLSAIDRNEIRLIRTQENSYRLTGLNRDLILQTNF